MAADTNKSSGNESTTLAEDTTAKVAATKRAPRPRALKPGAPPSENAASVTPKLKPSATKTVARPATKKLAEVKKTVPEPEPFVTKNSKAEKPAKVKKAKLVRDSFTMPDGEYEQIAALKKRCLNGGVAAKKSEILRAAIANLAKLSDSSLLSAVRRLEVIKTGRPAKAKGTK